MTSIHWELSVFSRAVKYLNLSAASSHVGLSQPQLSRIIKRIEEELGIPLLDRSVRRKSSWTGEARRLAEIYERSQVSLGLEISGLAKRSGLTHLRVGTLEGMAELAARYCHRVFGNSQVKALELDVFEVDELENLFLNGGVEIVFTSREIARRKPRFFAQLGVQRLRALHASGAVRVMSHYERGNPASEKPSKENAPPLVISNSLMIRKHWLETYGGSGLIPSGIETRGRRDPARKAEGESPVFAIGSERLPEEIWKTLFGRG